MSQRPRNSDRVPSRRPATTPVRTTSNRPRAVQPQRDPFPYVMGGIIGAMAVGLILVIFLLVNNNNNNGGTNVGVPPVGNPTADANSPLSTAVANIQPTSEGGDPPRMELKAFKALYDDPAKRPIIIDVRAPDAYQAGHIKGAVSFPEADVATRYNELPKDKLVVAYCQ